MDLRPATPEDVPQVIPLVKKICDLHRSWDPQRFGFKDNIEQIYHNWMIERANDERSPFFIAERHGKIVAYIVGSVEREIPIYWMPECGWLHDLWVDEAYRNEGIARQLVMLSIEHFKSIGLTQVRLQTAQVNEPARSLFASCNFRVCTQEMLLEL